MGHQYFLDYKKVLGNFEKCWKTVSKSPHLTIRMEDRQGGKILTILKVRDRLLIQERIHLIRAPTLFYPFWSDHKET